MVVLQSELVWVSLLLCSLLYSQAYLFFRGPLSSAQRIYSLADDESSTILPLSDVGVVLLAGGKGKRMKCSMPKQFLPILGKPAFLRSLDIFRALSDVSSIVIVLDESYREDYRYLLNEDARIKWADPGVERQDSVFNGLSVLPDSCSLVAVHDAARPLVTKREVLNCLHDGMRYGAAVLGVPMKATVKESADGEFVLRTVPRSRLWEIHTPQVAQKSLFLRGFEKVKDEQLEVTDDVSVIEALGWPVKITLGEYTNIKLTTPDDLQVAEQILLERGMYRVGRTGYDCRSERYRDSLGASQGE
jgi:2-C-methyl-D-erythritol 4-phosphate cytidylyltransferase